MKKCVYRIKSGVHKGQLCNGPVMSSVNKHGPTKVQRINIRDYTIIRAFKPLIEVEDYCYFHKKVVEGLCKPHFF